MAKTVRLQWTDLQKQIAALAAEGKTLDDLVEAGFTKSLVSKVLNAIKSGQNPLDNREPRTENRNPPKHTTIPPKSTTDILANAQELRFVPRVYTTDYSPIIRAAQDASVEFWGWPKDMALGDFLDTALHFLFREHGIILAGYTISDEAREALDAERKAQEA